MACRICGAETNEPICNNCKRILPNCIVKNHDQLSNASIMRLGMSPYWKIYPENPQIRINLESGKVGFCKGIKYYIDNKILYFSEAFIPVINISNFSVNFWEHNGKSMYLIQVTTRDPSIRLTDHVFIEEKDNKDEIQYVLIEMETAINDAVAEFKENLQVFDEYFMKLYFSSESFNEKSFTDQEKQKESYNRQQSNTSRQRNTSSMSLQEAMTLYMLEDGYTADQVKKQRKRLIKAFHPDVDSSDETTSYAAKINDAYDVLMKYL